MDEVYSEGLEERHPSGVTLLLRERSERKFASKLNNATRTSGYYPPKVSIGASELRLIVDIVVDWNRSRPNSWDRGINAELSVIEGIESLNAQLEVCPLAEGEALDDAHVEILNTGTCDGVSTTGAESPGKRLLIRIKVEPLGATPLRPREGIANYV